MQTTVDTFNKEVLMAINRDEAMLKEKAFSAYAFNACLLGVDFVYINVCISALAALKADNEHAKRYHWKNVVAGISEGIKYIYTFKENENKTLIRYLTTILNDSGIMIPEITDSLSVLQDLLDKFKIAIEENLEEYGKRFLDSCSVFEKLHKVYELLGCEGEFKLSNNHFGKLYKLHNLYSLVLYSMLDLLSITDSYLSSKTELEAALNMRYFLIVKTSVLTHIVGYTEKEASISLWNEIKGFIPESDSQLHDMAATMDSYLRESVKDQNIKRKRAKLLHLSFSKNKPGDVKEILSVLDTFDPLSEFYKVLDLIKLLVKVIKFLDRLTVSMDKEVTIENQKHLDKIRSMSSSLRDMIECNVKDKAQKEELLTSINDNEFKIIDLLKNH